VALSDSQMTLTASTVCVGVCLTIRSLQTRPRRRGSMHAHTGQHRRREAERFIEDGERNARADRHRCPTRRAGDGRSVRLEADRGSAAVAKRLLACERAVSRSPTSRW